MNNEIKELSRQLHILFEKLMATNPWDAGYGEVSAIHEHLLRILRDRAHLDFAIFTKYLKDASAEINETWSSSKSSLAPWDQWLRPVFTTIKKIISSSVPLLALLP